MSLLTVRDITGFTKPPRGSALFFVSPMAVKKVDEKVATTTISNSTSETSLGSLTLPAVALTNQGGAAVSMSGTISNSSVAAGTARLRAKIVIGGSTVTFAESTAITCSTSTSLRAWTISAGVVGSTLSTQLRSWSDLAVSQASTSQVAPSTYTGLGYQSVIVPNSSAQSTITVTGQLSAASTNFSISADVATLLQLN